MVPTVIAATCLALVQGAGLAAILLLVVLYNALRLGTGVWALGAGYGAGMQVSRALANSWLTRAASRINPVAGFAVGLLVPKALVWLLAGADRSFVAIALGVGLVGAGLAFRFPSRATSFRFGLVTLVAALLLAGGMA